MKTYNILHTEWSNGWGGQEIRILLECQELIRAGHKVTILCVPGSQIAHRARTAGIGVIECPMRHAYDPIALISLIRLMRRERFHVVNTHSSVDSWIASIAARLSVVPVIIRTRHLSVPVPSHFLNIIYRIPDAVITTGEATRQQLIGKGMALPERVFSIPTGVDIKRFDFKIKAEYLREEFGIDKGQPVVSMVAVLRSWKRHEVLLEACRRLKKRFTDIKILLVGDGPGKKRIEDCIEEMQLKDSVIMTGYRNDVPEIVSISNVCTITSDKAEGVPQAVLQYLAMAKPVVATDAGGIPEVVQHGKTGILVTANDANALAQGITSLLENPELGHRLGAAGRQLVLRDFTVEKMANKVLGVINGIYQRKER